MTIGNLVVRLTDLMVNGFSVDTEIFMVDKHGDSCKLKTFVDCVSNDGTIIVELKPGED